MKNELVALLLFLNLVLKVFSIVQNWEFESSTIDLLSIRTWQTTPAFDGRKDNTHVTLYKYFDKNDDGSIIYKNYLDVYEGTEHIFNGEVFFDQIGSFHYYAGDHIVCPRGKYHPMYFQNNECTTLNLNNFQSNGDWELKCIHHSTDYFLVFYLMNGGHNLIYKKESDGSWVTVNTHQEIYGVKLRDGSSYGEYELAYLVKDDNKIKLIGAKYTLNQDGVNRNDCGQWHTILNSSTYTRGCFENDYTHFYFFTYTNASDFASGYYDSSDDINYLRAEDYSVTINKESPLEFVDQVEIQDIKFINNYKYAYYTIYNPKNEKTYHGIIDTKKNKVVFNTEEKILKYVPYTDISMLAITSNGAYEVCVIKKDGNCVDSYGCSESGYNYILDIKGNKCATSCESGFLLLRENMCSDSCDESIYIKQGNECGLCINFYPSKPYKIINTTNCLAEEEIPEGAEIYNRKLYLLTCKDGYKLEEETCVIDCKNNCAIQTTVVIPPTTVINLPTTVIIPPTTVIFPPTTVLTPPTTVIIPPTTVITPPTTVIIPLTTLAIPPKVNTNFPTIIPSTQPEIKCSEEKCLDCNEESSLLNLCLSCNEVLGYKKVNYTLVFTEFVDCLKKEDPLLKNFYYNETSEEYRPCYKTCKKCLIGGDAETQNCLECETNYMFRPGDNPHNNCVAYSEFYYINSYNQYKSLPSLNCPEEAKYLVKEKNYCIYDCKKDNEYKYLYNGRCLKNCPIDTTNNSFICSESPSKSYLGVNEIYMKENNDLKVVDTLVKTYISEFNYTNNHASLYDNDFYNILVYKNPKIIDDLSLKMSKVDFKGCYEKVKATYGIEEELVITVVDKKSNNPTSYYSFFHPKSGQKLDAENICKEEVITVKENLTTILNANDTKYELQSSLTNQGINIFDMNDPFYTDLCFDFKNPKNRDIPLSDRIKNVFPNVTLCSDGCQNEGINLEEMTATCNCKFNDITNNEAIKENAVLDSMVGEIFDLINSSNILVVKCYKYIFKYFKNSIGGILNSSLIALNLILTFIFFSQQFPKISEYITSITYRYISYLSIPSISFPPKRNTKFLTHREKEKPKKTTTRKRKSLVDKKDEDKKNILTITSRDENLNNSLHGKAKRKSKLRKTTNKNVFPKNQFTNEITSSYLDENGIIKKFVEEYLETSPDDMEYDDAIKKDNRTFCQYFGENLKEKQIIANTFFAHDPIKTRAIKIILFNLNLILYFVINGLFISESYISELYNSNEEDENFFSFLPRSIERLLYTTIVSLLIGYLTSFFFLEEKKVQGIFKRDKENIIILKQNINNLIKTLKIRYISFIIVVFVILIMSLYYLLCFNYVYPKTQMEWIKSSIAIIIIIQILSILQILLEAILRFLSFKCESEKLFKFGKLFS